MHSHHRSLHTVRVVATALVLTVVLSAVPPATPAVASLAQTDGSTTSEPPESPDIIPRPNTGSAPEDAGDRGGSLQSMLFVVVIAGIVVIGAFVVRESRRARRERGF